MSTLEAQVAALRKSVEGLRVGAGKKKNKAAKAALPVQPGKKKSRRKATARVMDGEILISRKELLVSLAIKSEGGQLTGTIDLVPGEFSFLKGISGSFERYRFEKLHLFYKPAVGATVGGMVSMGADWTLKYTQPTRAKISGFTPNMTSAVWQDTETKPLVLPKTRLQSRQWYVPEGDAEDKGPARLLYAVDSAEAKGKTVGEIWVAYTVKFSGTKA